jgi:hypothetical protein
MAAHQMVRVDEKWYAKPREISARNFFPAHGLPRSQAVLGRAAAGRDTHHR